MALKEKNLDLAQKNEKESELSELADIQREASEILEEEKYQKYLDSLPQKEKERLEQESLEITRAEESVKEKDKRIFELSDEEAKRRQAILDSDKVNADFKEKMDEINTKETKQDSVSEEVALAMSFLKDSAKGKENQDQWEKKWDWQLDEELNGKKHQESLEEVDKEIKQSVKEPLETLEKIDNVDEQIEKTEQQYLIARLRQDAFQAYQEDKDKEPVDLTYPKQKRDFLSETDEISDKKLEESPNIKESLEILGKLDKVGEKIADKEKEIQDLQGQDKDKEKESTKTILDSEVDEAYQKSLQEQLERHQKELEELQKQREELEKAYEASIENLIKQGDIKDLFKNLQTFDKAFANLLNKTAEECNLASKQRIEKLELAMQNKEVKEAVSGFVKELHKNRKEVKKEIKELDLQAEQYHSMNKLYDKSIKGNEKAKEELREQFGEFNKKHPTFKENYPKLQQRVNELLKNHQNKQEQTQTQQNTMARSL